jgi:hypothetical protein
MGIQTILTGLLASICNTLQTMITLAFPLSRLFPLSGIIRREIAVFCDKMLGSQTEISNASEKPGDLVASPQNTMQECVFNDAIGF